MSRNRYHFTFILVVALLLLSLGCGTPQEAGTAAPETAVAPAETEAPRIEYCFEKSSKYTYDELVSDLRTLQKDFGSMVRVDSIGESLDGRDIPDIKVGNPDAPANLLVTGGIHGREYMTVQLVMQEAYDLLGAWREGGQDSGDSLLELLENTEVHFVPVSNPDGVTISQLGLDAIRSDELKRKVAEAAAFDESSPDEAYLTQWKANAAGVDNNRNFDAMWDIYLDGPDHISSSRYKGPYPGSEPETEALIRLTEKYRFNATISYHTQGEVIYWYFGQLGPFRHMSEKLAQALADETGYPLDPDFISLDPAGYKDWAITVGIPSVTVEVGHGDNPVDPAQFHDVVSQNRNNIPTVLKLIHENELRSIDDRGALEIPEGSAMAIDYCSEFISLRDRPATSGEVLARIGLGESVMYVRNMGNGFSEVEYDGKRGYVLNYYLREQ